MTPLRRLYRRRLAEMADVRDPALLAGLRRLGLVPPSGEPVVLGSGEFGTVVRSASPGRVVKLTDDPDEAEVAGMLLGNAMPGMAAVFSVDELRAADGSEAWAIGLEELRRLPARDVRAIDAAVHRSGGIVMGGGLNAAGARSIYRLEPRLRPLLDSCVELGVTPDLSSGENVMARPDGSWVLADLGPAMLS